MLVIRSALFYIGYTLVTTIMGFVSLLICSWLPYGVRAPFLLLWNRFTLSWLKLTCGVRYRVVGGENLPNTPTVVLSKHESQWETYYLQLALHPIATILKQELLAMPGFGWGLRLMKPIPIDRGSPREAIKQMLRLGQQRLQEDKMSVLVFPEGTRTAPGEKGRYAKGGAALAIKAGVPIIPIAHDAATFWPPHRWVKYPGTISVIIGKPIMTEGGNANELTNQAAAWIEGEVARLRRENPGRGAGPGPQ